MNREDIIRMAREAGMLPGRFDVWDAELADIERFAALVAAASAAKEREACAKVCEEADDPMNDPYQNALARELAETIRARGVNE